jgi:3-hydroxyisobutyrate dehydrogenase-like beta-hydroxyacid dehydrogenase
MAPRLGDNGAWKPDISASARWASRCRTSCSTRAIAWRSTTSTKRRCCQERQARRGASPRDLADRCEIVFVSLPTLAAFREVAFGADGLIPGAAMKLLVNTCTVGVPFVREIEQAMAARGVTVVDCPISGGPPGARAGTLSVMVSGDPAAIDRVRPIVRHQRL